MFLFHGDGMSPVERWMIQRRPPGIHTATEDAEASGAREQDALRKLHKFAGRFRRS
jgi:hypothetical protein